MYYSEEIYNAMKIGYKFEFLRGYLFDKEYIFNDYITDLYQIKKSHDNSDPMYLISKLLMNSLYGRFGMNFIMNEHKIIDDNDLYDFIDNNTISELIQLDNNNILISFINENKINNEILSNTSTHNISISIASAIYANARIYRSKFKNNFNFNLFYTDTESIYIDKI